MGFIQWKKAFLVVTDVYGYKGGKQKLPKSDVVIYSQLPNRILEDHKYTLHKYFKTLHIDLRKDEEVLFSELNRSTRYKSIRPEEII